MSIKKFEEYTTVNIKDLDKNKTLSAENLVNKSKGKKPYYIENGLYVECPPNKSKLKDCVYLTDEQFTKLNKIREEIVELREKEKELLKMDKKIINERSKHTNYMFFQNLNQIKSQIDDMLKMDEKEIDDLITNGHDWIGDHISTSKNDIEDVYSFLKNRK